MKRKLFIHNFMIDYCMFERYIFFKTIFVRKTYFVMTNDLLSLLFPFSFFILQKGRVTFTASEKGFQFTQICCPPGFDFGLNRHNAGPGSGCAGLLRGAERSCCSSLHWDSGRIQ